MVQASSSSPSGDKAIRPIPTHYAGCHFRSRLEARWAVFFDALDIEWEYEPEGFETPAGRYLPDFRIQMADWTGAWFEVKPHNAPDDPRHEALCIGTAHPLIVARGMPRNYSDQLQGKRSALTAFLFGDRGGAPLRMPENPRASRYPAAIIGPEHGPSLGECQMWDSITKGRPFICSVEEAPHFALYGACPEHHHRPPVSSPDVDRAYAAARSARFGT